jgi:hypothetical protein
LEPHRGFSIVEGEGPGAILDGFTIVNGYTTFGLALQHTLSGGTPKRIAHDLSGAGIKIQNASPVIRNCVVRSCRCEFTGGAISIEVLSNATVLGCTLQGNLAGSEGGGITIETASHPKIANCVITGNRGSSGGGISCAAGGMITNCLIAGNIARERGGGVFAMLQSAVTLDHSIVWANCAADTGGEIWVDVTSETLSVRCSAFDAARVMGGGVLHEIGTNVHTSPLFCGARACDTGPGIGGFWLLREDSPCLPPRSPCGTRIGPLGPGCLASPVAPTTWTDMRSRYR